MHSNGVYQYIALHRSHTTVAIATQYYGCISYTSTPTPATTDSGRLITTVHYTAHDSTSDRAVDIIHLLGLHTRDDQLHRQWRRMQCTEIQLNEMVRVNLI